jgi:hypothetical protein
MLRLAATFIAQCPYSLVLVLPLFYWLVFVFFFYVELKTSQPQEGSTTSKPTRYLRDREPFRVCVHLGVVTPVNSTIIFHKSEIFYVNNLRVLNQTEQESSVILLASFCINRCVGGLLSDLCNNFSYYFLFNEINYTTV